MKHLDPELVKLEQRIAPGLLGGLGDVTGLLASQGSASSHSDVSSENHSSGSNSGSDSSGSDSGHSSNHSSS